MRSVSVASQGESHTQIADRATPAYKHPPNRRPALAYSHLFKLVFPPTSSPHILLLARHQPILCSQATLTPADPSYSFSLSHRTDRQQSVTVSHSSTTEPLRPGLNLDTEPVALSFHFPALPLKSRAEPSALPDPISQQQTTAHRPRLPSRPHPQSPSATLLLSTPAARVSPPSALHPSPPRSVPGNIHACPIRM